MQAMVAQLVKDEHATKFSHVSLPANDNYLALLVVPHVILIF